MDTINSLNPFIKAVFNLLNSLDEYQCELDGEQDERFWDINQLFNFYEVTPEKQNIFNTVLQIFLVLGTSQYFQLEFKKMNKNKTAVSKVTFAYLKEILENPIIIDKRGRKTNIFKRKDGRNMINKQLIKFITLLNLLLFWRNQKKNRQISTVSFLLQYRGLSNSGISIMQQLSLSPCEKSMRTKRRKIREEFGKTNESIVAKVFWYDNLYRSLKGFHIEKEHINACYTVCSQTLIPSATAIPIVVEHPGVIRVSDLFNRGHINSTGTEIKHMTNDFLFYAIQIPEITIPIRAFHKKVEYVFEELDLLPFAPGEGIGTLQILKNLKNQAGGLNSGYYTFCSLDYDLYWRCNRLFYTNDLLGRSLSLVKQSLVLILAPWHVIWKLSLKMWKFCLPFFAADRCFTFNSRASINAPFVHQLTVWFSLFKYRFSLLSIIATIEYKNLKSTLKFIVKTLIPFVSRTLFFIKSNQGTDIFLSANRISLISLRVGW